MKTEQQSDNRPMVTQCAWCGEYQHAGLRLNNWWRVPQPLTGYRITHGICPRCSGQFGDFAAAHAAKIVGVVKQ